MGRPLMMHVIEALPEEVDQLIVPVSYKREIMEEFIKIQELPVKITIIDEPEPLGTGGAVKNVEKYLDKKETFLVLNGDIISSVDLSEFVAFHKRKKAIASITLWEVEDPTPFGVAQLDNDLQIMRFQEKPSKEEAFSKLINAGAYAIEPEVLDDIGPGFVSMERTVFPKLLPRGMFGFSFKGYWADCGTRQGLIDAHKALMTKFGSYIAENVSTVCTDLFAPFCVEPECRLVNAKLGPGAYVGQGSVVLDDSEIINSILLPGSRVGRYCKLENCIVDEKHQIPNGTCVKNMIFSEAHEEQEN